MQYLISEKELVSLFQSSDFVLKTQKQIAKDFYTTGVNFQDNFETEIFPYEQIVESVNEKLEDILKLGESTTLQLLYQIDIPQHDFLELISDPEFIQKMSALIIRREAYKVFLRTKF